MLTSLSLIFLVGLAMGAICQRIRLPRIIGMLATGILLGPCALDLLDPAILSVSADLRKIAGAAKGFALPVVSVLGFDGAQVTAGGIRTAEFDPKTLQSRLVPGLYAAGEVLDIDGDCGGYNLQWAWSSGYLAGLLKSGT